MSVELSFEVGDGFSSGKGLGCVVDQHVGGLGEGDQPVFPGHGNDVRFLVVQELLQRLQIVELARRLGQSVKEGHR